MITKSQKSKRRPSSKPLLSALEQENDVFSFGMFLRVARSSLDLTQAELARELGISRGSLCDIEKGRQLVSPSLAVQIAKAAGLSVKIAVKACLQDQLNKANIRLKIHLSA